MSRGRRHGRTVPAIRRPAAGAAGARRHVERGGGAAARHRDQVGDGVAAALAAVAVRRAGLCRRRRHALAAAVGHGRSRALGRLRGLERAGVMDRLDLGGLFLHFLVLWFVAIGGPSTILPDIHRYVVDVHHLLTNTQFAEIYTLAQVAPGPNAMYVTLIGWHLAGWKGVAATTIPLLVPATTLTLLVGHLNERYPNAPIGRASSPRPDADYDWTCVRERDDPDARGEPRLARLLDHAAYRRRGPAQAMEPAVAVRGRRAGGYIGFRLSGDSRSEEIKMGTS